MNYPTREYQIEHWRALHIDDREVLDNDPQNVVRYICTSRGSADVRQKLLEQLVRDRAGICARHVAGPDRADSSNAFRIWVDVPSPEGLLLP